MSARALSASGLRPPGLADTVRGRTQSAVTPEVSYYGLKRYTVAVKRQARVRYKNSTQRSRRGSVVSACLGYEEPRLQLQCRSTVGVLLFRSLGSRNGDRRIFCLQRRERAKQVIIMRSAGIFFPFSSYQEAFQDTARQSAKISALRTCSYLVDVACLLPWE